MQRSIDTAKSAVDVGLSRRQRHPAEQGMRKAVMGDRVPLGNFAADEIRMRDRVAAQEKE
jgi:hypothetical protein